MQNDLRLLKDKLLIPEVWQRLGLQGSPGKACRSPFRQDRHPSFSIHEAGRRWKDHGTGESGDVIDFIAAACQVDNAEATRRFLALAGVQPQPSGSTPQSCATKAHRGGRPVSLKSQRPNSTPNPSPGPGPGNPGTVLHRGSAANVEAVARSRGLDPAAVALARGLGTLAFAEICGSPCWLLGDGAQRIVEARRMDGLPFPEYAGLGERKAHTLRGSHKDWPVGAAVLKDLPHIRALMLVEGGPDYLAALHFILRAEAWDVLPIAMLGRSAGSRIAPEALDLIGGRPVRIYPHQDADGGGLASAKTWADQLHAHGSAVQIFQLCELHRQDGRPIKDLNDAVELDSTEHLHLQKLTP